ncbi:MAG: hypothetical protein JSW39_12905, partial [Desulfobacterales bacterium]
RGEMHLLDRSRILWNAAAEDLKAPAPKVSWQLGPLHLDLGELYALARDFVPDAVGLDVDQASAPATLTIEELRFDRLERSGPDKLKPDTLQLKNLVLQIPALSLKVPPSPIRLRDMTFRLADARMALHEFFPADMNLTTAINLGHLDVQGAQPVQVKGLAIPAVSVSVKELHKSPEALWGITARIAVEESLALESLHIPGVGGIDGLQETLEAEVHLTPTAAADLSIATLSVSAPAVRLNVPTLGPFTTNLSLGGALAGIKVQRIDPLQADIRGFQSRLAVGEFLKAELRADAANLAFDGLQAQGNLALDLPALVKQVPLEIRQGADLSGKIEARWNVGAKRPPAGAMQALVGSPTDVQALLKHSGFLQQLELAVQLHDLAVKLPLAQGEILRAGQISTDKPLMVTVKNGAQHVDTSGKVVVGKVESLPSLGKLKKPLKLMLVFSGRQDALQSLSFSQSLQIDPLRLKQNLELHLSGIDRLLARGLDKPWPLWLKAAGGSLRAEVTAEKNTDLSIFSESLRLNGWLKAGAEVQCTPGREVKTRSWVESPGLDLRLGNLLEIVDLQSHLNLAKNYRLSFETTPAGEREEKAAPLSAEVLQSSPSVSETGSPFVRRLRGDLKGPFTGAPALSFKSARIQAQPLPLELKHQALDFYLEKGLPKMEHFQIDVLGGSIIGAGAIFHPGREFYLSVQGAFSGLNTKRLLPEVVQGVADTDAEISGQVSLNLPLVTAQAALLQGMELEAELTQIGASALERVLFALDPYESNEAIVRQRQTLRNGTPRWIRLGIKHGILSMRGEIEAKGIRVDLPPIDRLNLTNLPALEGLQEALVQLGPLIDVLRAAAADVIVIDPNGDYRLVSDEKKGITHALE